MSAGYAVPAAPKQKKPKPPRASATCTTLTIRHGQSGVVHLVRARRSLPIISSRLAAGTPARRADRVLTRLGPRSWRYTSTERDAPARVEQDVLRFVVRFGKGKKVSRIRTVRCIARVVHEAHAVQVNVAGNGRGVVTSAPAGLTCSHATTPCARAFVEGVRVTLSAAPSADSTFSGWSGACTGTGDCVLTVDAARSVTATFAKRQFALSVAKAGTGGGTVASSPGGISCGTVCTAVYDSGTSVMLTAEPDQKSVFTGWSGACSGTGACTVDVAAATSVTATFTKRTFALSVTKTGTGAGAVTATPSGINCGATCTGVFDVDTVVTLTAVPAATTLFTGWSGACTGSQTTCTVTMSAARFVTAAFAQGVVVSVEVNGDYPQGVLYKGNAPGRIVSDDGKISCDERGPGAPGNTCSALYLPEDRISFMAEVTEPNTHHYYWYHCDAPNQWSTYNPCEHFAYEFTKPLSAHFQYG